MLPHGQTELAEMAAQSALVSLKDVNGWEIQEWHLTPDDVERAIVTYQAVLKGDVDEEMDELLQDLGIDPLGTPALTAQRQKVVRADAIEIAAAATLMSHERITVDDLHMPNVPKMSVFKSDSGIDVLGIELDPSETGVPKQHERLIIASVKHTITNDSSGMRSLLEKSVGEDLSGPYMFRQLVTLNGRLIQSGIPKSVARRVMYFLRSTLKNPQVNVVCVAAAAPAPDCDLAEQPAKLTETKAPSMTFRMLFIPGIDTLHDRLIPQKDTTTATSHNDGHP